MTRFLLWDVLVFMVTVATWLTPSPRHAEGLLVRYGNQTLIERVAAYCGYDLSPYRDRCGVSLISPTDLGKIVWVKLDSGAWYGPCLSMDTTARRDFHQIVYRNQEVAEVSNALALYNNFCCGEWGEIYIGACPPSNESQPSPYTPPLKLDPNPNSITPSMYPYPVQEWPVECHPNMETMR